MAQPFPYMQFYFADYDADTAHLSTLEHGVYFLLIKAYWKSGRALADNDRRLAILAGLSLAEWQRVRPDSAPFFVAGDGLWRHGRIDEELDKVRGRIEQARSAGRASGERRRSESGGGGSGGRSSRRSNARPAPGAATPESDSESEGKEEESSSASIAALVSAWDSMAKAHGLPAIRALTEARRRSAQARLREHGESEILKAVALVGERPFLLGGGRRGWKADFDWLLRPASIPRILERQRYLSCDEEDEKPSGWRR
jgi:uncharacterized protein YdaU (DUF1376 family)